MKDFLLCLCLIKEPQGGRQRNRGKHIGRQRYHLTDNAAFNQLYTNILFAVQKVSGDQGSQDLGGTEIIQRWWAYMKDIMETNPDNSPVSIPLHQCFYME